MSASGIVFSGLPLGVPYNAGILEHIYDRLFGEGYDDRSIASLLSMAVAASGANPDYEGTDGNGLFGFKKGEYRQNPFLSDDPLEEADRQVDYVLSNRESYQLPEFDEDYLAKAIFNDVSYQRHVRSGESDWLDTYMNKWLWPAENSIKAGHKDGKWGVYSDSAGRNIGPGLHEGTFGDVLDYSGNTSYSTEDINRIVRNDLDRRVTRIKMDLDDIGYSDLWDRLSDGGKAVLLDINYNVGVGGGSPKKWRRLVDSLATGNNERALSEMRSGDDRRMAIRQNMFNDFGGEYSEVSPFANGGKIHIKPQNRGKFTALKKRTGHSASWFKAHGTPAQKKMATFALNSRKWKHADGGWLYEEGGDKGTPIYQFVGRDNSIWSPEEISQIQAQAIQNPGWFWSDEGSGMRQSMYNAGLDSIVQSIWDETPEDVRQSVPESALPNSVRSKQYQRGVTNAIGNTGETLFPVVGGLAFGTAGAIGAVAGEALNMGVNAISGGKKNTWGDLFADPEKHPVWNAAWQFTNPGYLMTGPLEASGMFRPSDAGVARLIGQEKGFLRDAVRDFSSNIKNSDVAFSVYDNIPVATSQSLRTVARNAAPALAETAAKQAPGIAPYVVQDLGGGYMLKSLMRGNPLEKQISKNGTVSVNNVKALVNKGSNVEKAVVDKVLASEEFAGKKAIDYNKFRKAVQDELITYDRTPDARWANYGMDRIGVSDTGVNLHDYTTSESRTAFNKWLKDKGYTYDVLDNVNIDDAQGYIRPDGTRISLDDAVAEYNLEHRNAQTFTFSSPRIPLGSNKHYSTNTLGHSRTYTTADEPDVLHVMESQSDWAQEGRVAKHAAYVKDRMAKHPGTESDPDSWLSYAKDKIETRKKEIESIKEMLKTGISENGDKLEPYAIKQIEEELLPAAERRLVEAKSRFYGPTPQEIYLSDNYTSRQIQENLRYAAEKGQTKMRYPTRETAAKIEGYSKSRSGVFELEPELRERYDDFMADRQQKVNDIIREYAPEGYIDDYLQRWEEIPDEAIEVMDEAQRVDLQRRSKLSWDFEKSDAGKKMKKKINDVYRKYDERKWLDENVPETYLPQHETILRKYDAFPKQYQKLYKGADVRTVTDPKGNTWYEVDVPENYLQQEWQYANGGILLRPFQ